MTIISATSNKLRRLKKLQHIGLFAEDKTGAVYDRAVTVEDLKSAYALAHDRFVECGYMKPHPSGMRIRTFETSKNTATFIAKIANKIVGVISLIMDTDDFGLPSEQPFTQEIPHIRERERERVYIAEIDNLAVISNYQNSAITTELMRCMYAQALYVGCSDLICSVSRWFVPIFNSIEFEQVGQEKNYAESEGLNDPVRLLRLSRIAVRGLEKPPGQDPLNDFWRWFFVDKNPYRLQVATWHKLAEKFFDTPSEISNLFTACPELFYSCTPIELDAIKRRLGNAFEMAAPKDLYERCFDKRSGSGSSTGLGSIAG